ncbi:hypothetical protein Bhyg_13587 [Pseudolycoriella hygida]|uniref:Uncharacterized protein n=1 Tax=Pseudolycoriella hygida TaxID=35572 RepID=A0A9Q0RUU3_9DIPT|nr:hypothetical protein Bhyg_13587 [Pseudolycoriella hygida]
MKFAIAVILHSLSLVFCASVEPQKIKPVEIEIPLPPQKCLDGTDCPPCVGKRDQCSCYDYSRPPCCGQCPITYVKGIQCLAVMCKEYM